MTTGAGEKRTKTLCVEAPDGAHRDASRLYAEMPAGGNLRLRPRGAQRRWPVGGRDAAHRAGQGRGVADTATWGVGYRRKFQVKFCETFSEISIETL